MKAYHVKINMNQNIKEINKLSDFDYFIYYFYVFYVKLFELEYKYIVKYDIKLYENEYYNEYYSKKLYEFLEMKNYVENDLSDIFKESILYNYLHDGKFNKISNKEIFLRIIKM